jgi:hypothetical protein
MRLEIPDAQFLEKMIFTPDPDGDLKLWVELFHPVWQRPQAGSGRHLSIPPLQMKGVGTTLPQDSDDYGAFKGTLGLSDAIRSFILSCLIDSSIFTGSVLPVSVQQQKGDARKHFGIYSRFLDFPRLAGIGPDLDAAEKNELIEALKQNFPGSTLSGIQKQIIASHAAMVFLTGVTNATADNLLLDGRCIDEETLDWPDRYGELSLHLEILWEAGSEWNWEKGKLRTSSFSQAATAIDNSLRAFSFLMDKKDVITREEAKEIFYQHLLALSDDPSLVEIWRQDLRSEDLSAWMKNLLSSDWEVVGKKDCGNKIFSVKLTKKLRTANNLAMAFNGPERSLLNLQVQKFHKLTLDPSSAIDPASYSRLIFTWIGRSAFVLPVRSDKNGNPVPNEMSWQEFWDFTLRKWPGLSGESVGLCAWDGQNEIILTRDRAPRNNIIPLYLTSGSHLIHSYKTIIRGSENG